MPSSANQTLTIPLYTPEIRGREWEYVKECLDTSWVSSVGAFVDRFERLVAERTGVQYAVATINGTSALHIALQVAGIQPDDEVLVPTLTFIAPANAVRYLGAWPVFIDAESAPWQMDPNLVKSFLRNNCQRRAGSLYNRQSGRRVSAILPVHILGHPVDMAPLLELAHEYGLRIIEDAAEALGVKYKGQPVGGLGDLGCLSFNGNKLITTGGGGMILTNDPQMAAAARHLTTQAKTDHLEYVHDVVGYNYRMPNVLAAIGCAQIEQLDGFIETKRAHAAEYMSGLRNVPGVSFYTESVDAFGTYWLNTIRVNQNAFGMDNRQLLHALQARGINTRPLWQPMHHSPAHRSAESLITGVADQLYAECLSLPSSVGLTSDEVAFVCQAIAAIGAWARSDQRAIA